MEKDYDIIKLILSEEDYDADNYLEFNIPMGCSRIGGQIVDLPDDISYPDDFYFMAQLNCAEIKPFDKIGLLPESGFLYFFINEDMDDGHVFYTPKSKESLHRVTKIHDGVYYYGKTVEAFQAETEKLSSRYELEDGIKEWAPWAGQELSKIYGIYTNCNADEEEVLQFMKDESKIILLQVGSDGAGEGCSSVIINKNDLKKRDFTKCIIQHNQS